MKIQANTQFRLLAIYISAIEVLAAMWLIYVAIFLLFNGLFKSIFALPSFIWEPFMDWLVPANPPLDDFYRVINQRVIITTVILILPQLLALKLLGTFRKFRKQSLAFLLVSLLLSFWFLFVLSRNYIRCDGGL